MQTRTWLQAVALTVGIIGSSPSAGDEVALPHPEGLLQTLQCQWNSAHDLIYTEPSRPGIETVPLTNWIYYQPFSMLTNGRDLFDISLPRWVVSRDWRFVIEEYSCVPNRISITCNKGSTTITLDRRTLRGVEINTFEMGFVEEPPTVTVSHFSCALAP